MTLKFAYNDLDSLRRYFEQYPEQIACVVMEAEAAVPPAPRLPESSKELCEARALSHLRRDDYGLSMAFRRSPEASWCDSASVHFRQGHGKRICDFGLGGKREIMRLGGLDHDQPRVFLLSTTHGAETHALAASLETLRIFRERNVVDFLWRQGERLRTLVNQSIAENHLEGFFETYRTALQPGFWHL